MKKNEEIQCPHGKREGSLVLCEKSAEEIGALTVWINKEDGRIIVTPFWCAERCKLQGGEGHL